MFIGGCDVAVGRWGGDCWEWNLVELRGINEKEEEVNWSP